MSHFTDEDGRIGSPASDPLPVWDEFAVVLRVLKRSTGYYSVATGAARPFLVAQCGDQVLANRVLGL